jgi:hypothetical protein
MPTDQSTHQHLHDAPRHTPGPWRAYCRDITYRDGAWWPEEEFLQWEVEGPPEPYGRGSYHQADAHLIAAAPDLLHALERALENNTLPPDITALARHAIDKARGRRTE